MPDAPTTDPTDDIDELLATISQSAAAIAAHVRQAARAGSSALYSGLDGSARAALLAPAPAPTQLFTVVAPEPLVSVSLQPAPLRPPLAAPTTAPWSRRRLVGTCLLAFGGLVVAFGVYLFGLSSAQHTRDQAALQREIRTQIASAQAPIGGVIEEGAPVALLQIPAVGLEAAVVEGSDAATLKRAPGHLRTSPLPGQEGNSVLLGRRLTQGGSFGRIHELTKGDEITVVTGQGEQVFAVARVRTAAADDADVFDPGEDPTLTLVTSSSLFSDERLIVEATLDGDPVPAPGGQPISVGQEELGARGTTAQLAGLFLWAQTLLLFAVATVFLYRRWRAWPSYLITTPVLVAVLWLVFENVSLLLPSTM